MICISQCSTTGQHRSLTPTTALPSSCSTVVCEQSFRFRSASSCRPSPRKLVLTLSTDKISTRKFMTVVHATYLFCTLETSSA